MRYVLCLALAAVALVSCAHAGPPAGIVVDRDHTPMWIETRQTCVAFNTNGTCRTYVPTIVTHPEQWELKLRQENDEGWRDVSEDTYERCHDDEWCDTAARA